MLRVGTSIGLTGDTKGKKEGSARETLKSFIKEETGLDVAWEIESGRITFVQRHDLCGGCMAALISHHSSKQKTTSD